MPIKNSAADARSYTFTAASSAEIKSVFADRSYIAPTIFLLRSTFSFLYVSKQLRLHAY